MTCLDLAITLTFTNDYKINVLEEITFVKNFTESYLGTAVYTHEYTTRKRLHIHGYVKCSNKQERDTHNAFIKLWRHTRGKVHSKELFTPADIFRWQVYCHKDIIKTEQYEDWITRYSHDQSDLEQDDDDIEMKSEEISKYSLLFKD